MSVVMYGGELCLKCHDQNINDRNPNDRLRLLCSEMINLHSPLNDGDVTCSWHFVNTKTAITPKKAHQGALTQGANLKM